MLRRLRESDLSVAARIHREAQATIPGYPHDLHSPDEYLAFYRDAVWPTTFLMGGFDGPLLAGVMALRADWIDHLYVDPARHGRGIGTCLLRWALEQGDEWQLWTFQANHRARRFYEREGFRTVEQTDGSGNMEAMPDVRLHWRDHRGRY